MWKSPVRDPTTGVQSDWWGDGPPRDPVRRPERTRPAPTPAVSRPDEEDACASRARDASLTWGALTSRKGLGLVRPGSIVILEVEGRSSRRKRIILASSNLFFEEVVENGQPVLPGLDGCCTPFDVRASRAVGRGPQPLPGRSGSSHRFAHPEVQGDERRPAPRTSARARPVRSRWGRSEGRGASWSWIRQASHAIDRPSGPRRPGPLDGGAQGSTGSVSAPSGGLRVGRRRNRRRGPWVTIDRPPFGGSRPRTQAEEHERNRPRQ